MTTTATRRRARRAGAAGGPAGRRPPEYSGEFDTSVNPPVFHKGADATMTKHFGGRYGRHDWHRDGKEYVIRHTVRDAQASFYARVRGTNTDELEPAADGLELPWEDLWFYSNPVFVRLR